MTLTRFYQAEFSHQCQSGLIEKNLYTKVIRPHQAKPSYQRQSGFIGQSFHIDDLIRQSFTSTPIRLDQAKPLYQYQPGVIGHHWTELPHQCQPDLIRQNSTPTPTRFHWAEIYIDAKPSTLKRPGLIRQRPHINTNQALSGRAFISTPTRPYQVEFCINVNQVLLGRVLHQHQSSLIGLHFYLC